MTRLNGLRLSRWVGAALLSYGIALLIVESPLYPAPLGLLFLIPGLVVSISCAWAYRHFERSLDKESSRTRHQDRWAALLLIVLYLVGCAAWGQRYDSWLVILKSGKSGSGVILSKHARFEGRSARYELSVRVHGASSFEPVTVEVSGRSYGEVGVGDDIELSYAKEDGELMVASSDLAPRGLSVAHWAALFLALLGGGWAEVLGRIEGGRSGKSPVESRKLPRA